MIQNVTNTEKCISNDDEHVLAVMLYRTQGNTWSPVINTGKCLE